MRKWKSSVVDDWKELSECIKAAKDVLSKVLYKQLRAEIVFRLFSSKEIDTFPCYHALNPEHDNPDVRRELEKPCHRPEASHEAIDRWALAVTA
ncbi:hypothetical protein CB0940_03713 [Cercospora beticola]|uniref:Uncharacterized protein n=1 Tax=Cercospora beticola TaxID=122368 RepID=A0A2G5I1K2_CERBT|nr:hypothetical protein CB0940_03713 [Cercospora beticola]PIA98659.1 hypothetical protein CB0940_03713 [Cercospora beticola]